ncbi:DUF1643 domain-containing protein [Inhella gelatinilytica]|uniref:DUF1643 domain-containing protein n=1 Tax=Inhella gelatinilytica TaxID=2795030 RepID=A0A931IRN5_9BURK|nr:DUF1643 domain-containing protein [Inhella gelatinilytica]MBH9551425.1 DUF1643 domain-containing protein [Inhella gelatinilytica]
MHRDAALSRCRRYRYALWRRWDDTAPTVLFVMLNPSTADARQDDPTIRRCMGFAQAWGFGGLAVGNLFALRSPDPDDLRRAVTAGGPLAAIGPRNAGWLRRLAQESAQVVAAWGQHGELLHRGTAVARLFPTLHCLGQTQAGHPRHPLYVAASTPLRPWLPPPSGIALSSGIP